MKRYSMIAALLLGVFLTLFFLVVALNVALVKEPSSWLGQAGVLTGFVGVCLLVIDVWAAGALQHGAGCPRCALWRQGRNSPLACGKYGRDLGRVWYR